MAEEQSGDGPWLTVAAAARKMGISPRAVRGRIRRDTIEWKALENTGRLVRVPEGDVSPDDPGDDLDQLREERTEALIAAARAEERAAALAELVVELKAQLAEARRPWLARVLAALRQR